MRSDTIPDFGCRAHRPSRRTGHHWRWNLADAHPDRVTVAHGQFWSVALDRSEPDDEPRWFAIVDCAYADEVLRAQDVDTTNLPLVVVHEYETRDALEAALAHEGCYRSLERWEDRLLDSLESSSDGLGGVEPAPMPALSWKDDDEAIVGAVLADLRTRSVLGAVGTSLSATATCQAVRNTPTFVQLVMHAEGSLTIEVRGDFSYFGVELPDEAIWRFEHVGFTHPDRQGNLERHIPPDGPGVSHRDALVEALEAFRDVFGPAGELIRVARYEWGVGRHDPRVSEPAFAADQRRMDRMGRVALFDDGADRHGDAAETVVGVIDEESDSFALLVDAAHLDEWFNTVPDLAVAIPVGTSEAIDALLGDPDATCGDLEATALRHAWSTTQPSWPPHPPADNRDAQVFSTSIESWANEPLRVHIRDGEIIAIGWRKVISSSRVADNGLVYLIDGVIEPPDALHPRASADSAPPTEGAAARTAVPRPDAPLEKIQTFALRYDAHDVAVGTNNFAAFGDATRRSWLANGELPDKIDALRLVLHFVFVEPGYWRRREQPDEALARAVIDKLWLVSGGEVEAVDFDFDAAFGPPSGHIPTDMEDSMNPRALVERARSEALQHLQCLDRTVWDLASGWLLIDGEETGWSLSHHAPIRGAAGLLAGLADGDARLVSAAADLAEEEWLEALHAWEAADPRMNGSEVENCRLTLDLLRGALRYCNLHADDQEPDVGSTRDAHDRPAATVPVISDEEAGMTEPRDDDGSDWTDRTPDDLPEGVAASRHVVALFRANGLTFPEVPAHVVPYLRPEGGGYLTTIGAPWDSMAGYGLDFGGPAVQEVPGSYLRYEGPDFFVSGGRDNGYSSMWGFAARAGGIFVSVQLVLEGINDDVDARRPNDQFIRSFNQHLAPLMNRGTRPLTTAVIFSAYRGDAEVITTEANAWLPLDDSSSPPDLLPSGWGYALRSSRTDDTPVSHRPAAGASTELMAAMTFLDAAVSRE